MVAADFHPRHVVDALATHDTILFLVFSSFLCFVGKMFENKKRYGMVPLFGWVVVENKNDIFDQDMLSSFSTSYTLLRVVLKKVVP